MAMSNVALGLIGSFELRRGDAPVPLRHTAQRLLAFLALHSRPLEREYVAGNLWGGASHDHANASLRSALWRLNRTGCDLVRATQRCVAIASNVHVDVRSIDALAHELQEGRASLPRADIDRLCAAGDLWPDWYDEWLTIERERFRQVRLHALDAICTKLAHDGRFGEATEVALVAIAAEPLRETANRALIEVHLAEGNVSEAIRQYKSFRRRILTQLGAEPSRDLTRVLTQRIAVLDKGRGG
jgi:DNA-binding SARP family transcriptional activator